MEVTYLVWGHNDTKWWSWDLNPPRACFCTGHGLCEKQLLMQGWGEPSGQHLRRWERMGSSTKRGTRQLIITRGALEKVRTNCSFGAVRWGSCCLMAFRCLWEQGRQGQEVWREIVQNSHLGECKQKLSEGKEEDFQTVRNVHLRFMAVKQWYHSLRYTMPFGHNQPLFKLFP